MFKKTCGSIVSPIPASFRIISIVVESKLKKKSIS